MMNPPIIAIAPMMGYTDRHFRYFLRLLSQHIFLYTEMIHAHAVIQNREHLLRFDEKEHPIAIQLGGSDSKTLAQCLPIIEDYGYDEINLNVGCPSDRVQAGKFGACLMKEPNLVAECIAAMNTKTRIPVTVKCRIGVDEFDSYEYLYNFITSIAKTGCDTFIVHARKAWLKGLSPKENREIPPLDYEAVYQLQRELSHLKIIINGGITDLKEIPKHLSQTKGVMIGRLAYQDPYTLAAIDQTFFDNTAKIPSRLEILKLYSVYVVEQLQQDQALHPMLRHILELFRGVSGASAWRRYISEHAWKKSAGIEILEQASEFVLENS